MHTPATAGAQLPFLGFSRYKHGNVKELRFLDEPAAGFTRLGNAANCGVGTEVRVARGMCSVEFADACGR